MISGDGGSGSSSGDSQSGDKPNPRQEGNTESPPLITFPSASFHLNLT